MQGLQQGAFAHESSEGRRPSLPDDLQPVELHVCDEHLGKRRRLLGLLFLKGGGHVQVHSPVAVRIGQSRRIQLGSTVQDAVLLQSPKENLHRLLDFELMRLQPYLRVERLLVRIVDAGEVLQLSALHARVLSLRIPLLQLVHRHIQEHFVERNPLLLVATTHGVTVTAIGRYETYQRDGPRVREEGRHLPHPTDALRAVALAEAQVTVEPRPNVVPVQTVRVLAVQLHQLVLEGRRDGGLPRPAAPGHPQSRSLLLQGLVPLRPGQVARALARARRGRGALDDVRGRFLQGLRTEETEVARAVGAGDRRGTGADQGEVVVAARAGQDVDDGEEDADTGTHGHALVDQFVSAGGSFGAAPGFLHRKGSVGVTRHL
mmetsp:Transcript_32886/g.75683  ORF Transcript_32886/g.75683 Transcript_32886/m.75683 type:complete len:375 (-) Transcript_32886:130-1254(-)